MLIEDSKEDEQWTSIKHNSTFIVRVKREKFAFTRVTVTEKQIQCYIFPHAIFISILRIRNVIPFSIEKKRWIIIKWKKNINSQKNDPKSNSKKLNN